MPKYTFKVERKNSTVVTGEITLQAENLQEVEGLIKELHRATNLPVLDNEILDESHNLSFKIVHIR